MAMNSSDDPAMAQMLVLIRQWEAASDRRAIFLSCYQMMTGNTLDAIARGEFNDPPWVGRLLQRFAGYYFTALDAYELDHRAAPPVWQIAHDAARSPRTPALSNLLLGVNAHINYDLVLSLDDLLRPEWQSLSEAQRLSRYTDHCRVNDIIGATIDAVQDQVLEPEAPLLQLTDWLLGPLDEFLISRLIARWREDVWQHSQRLLQTQVTQEQASLVREVEAGALRIARLIGGDSNLFEQDGDER